MGTSRTFPQNERLQVNGQSEEEKQSAVRNDFWQWVAALTKHWQVMVCATLGSGVATFFQCIGQTVPTTIGWTGGLFAFFCAAFLTWRDMKNSADKLHAELEIHRNPPKLEVSLIRPDLNDPNFFLGAVRLSVSNNNKTKTARGVKVRIEALKCPEWYEPEMKRCMGLLKLPHALPLKGHDRVERGGYDIDPETELHFDVVGIAHRVHDTNSHVSLLLAPFAPSPDGQSTLSMLGDFQATGTITDKGFRDWNVKHFGIALAIAADGFETVNIYLNVTVPLPGADGMQITVPDGTPLY